MSNDYEIDYDEIRKIYRLETKSPKLYKLEPSFYKLLKKFVKDEKSKYLSSIESISAIESKKFENLKFMIMKIRELRLKKCLNMCLMYSRTNDLKEDCLIDFEIDFVKNILKLLDKQNEQTISLLSDKKEILNTDLSLIKVQVVESVPAFIGQDMKEYGPYVQNDVCELPETVCSLLMSRNIIRRID
ncbi:MAG: hypothetical protein V1824_02520 [archaeon]